MTTNRTRPLSAVDRVINSNNIEFPHYLQPTKGSNANNMNETNDKNIHSMLPVINKLSNDNNNNHNHNNNNNSDNIINRLELLQTQNNNSNSNINIKNSVKSKGGGIILLK